MEKELCEMTLEELWQLFPIILKKHNKIYKDWYEIEKNNLINIIDEKVLKRISHIGSTAVEGLIAKPTVDILLEIDKDANIDKIKNLLLDKGWLLMNYKDSPKIEMVFNKGYTKKGFSQKVYHLHVRNYDDWNELYFRDYLIEHKDIADKYGKLKLSLLEKYRNNRDGYTEAKSDFIIKYTEKAKKEYPDKYKPLK